MAFVLPFLVVLGLFLAVLLVLRVLDWRADRAAWARLAALQPAQPSMYDPEAVADLPEPARRYFNFAITPGTPLFPVVEVGMEGEFSLGTREKPNYRTMEARQILAAPHGFVWQLRLPGPIPISGSDSHRWTRFRLLGLVPVARLGGNPDHARSAYGRYVAESVFWAPAALLPGPGVVWEALGAHCARVIVRHEGLSQAVDVTVDAEGRPVEVSFMRWSDANPDRDYRLQPFGGTLSDFREVHGYRLPFRVEAGNMFGTGAYFPFFRAEVVAIHFPRPGG
jgi:hypothetical protein